MRISREQYYEDMAKALLKGYFLAVEEEKRGRKHVAIIITVA